MKKIVNLYKTACTKASVLAYTHSTTLLLMFGSCLLISGVVDISNAQGDGPTNSFTEAAYDDELVRNAVGNLFKLIEGAFGALIMVVAGLGAIVAAAMGAYRAAVGMLVVAVGAFILRALVSLFFGTDYADFDAA